MANRPISELGELFKTLPGKVGLKLLRRAGRRAAEVVREEAAVLAPRAIGKLQGSMMIKTRKEDDTAIEIDIGPSRGAWYGQLQEFGTAHHAAQPFLRPAFDARGPEAAQIFADELRTEIENHFTKG